MKGRRLIVMAALAAALWAFGAAPGRAAEDPAKANVELAARARAAFTQGDYAGAARLYEQLATRAPHDPTVLYNLGTAHAMAGERGLAIWRYLQALRLDPRDGDLRHNLSLLAPEAIKELGIAPLPPLNWIYLRFTANEWAAAAATAATVAMLLGALYFAFLHRRRAGGAVRALVMGLLFFAALAYPLAFAHYASEDDAWRAVVVAEQTEARAGPGLNQITTDNLWVGRVVRVLETTDNGWVKFTYAGGRMGYVEQWRLRTL